MSKYVLALVVSMYCIFISLVHLLVCFNTFLCTLNYLIYKNSACIPVVLREVLIFDPIDAIFGV